MNHDFSSRSGHFRMFSTLILPGNSKTIIRCVTQNDLDVLDPEIYSTEMMTLLSQYCDFILSLEGQNLKLNKSDSIKQIEQMNQVPIIKGNFVSSIFIIPNNFFGDLKGKRQSLLFTCWRQNVLVTILRRE